MDDVAETACKSDPKENSGHVSRVFFRNDLRDEMIAREELRAIRERPIKPR